MTNSLVVRIELFDINENGTIEIFDTPALFKEYPFTFQYKLYLPFSENEKSILEMLFFNAPVIYEFSPKLLEYFKNRKALYEEVSAKYLPIIKAIEDSDFSKATKRELIQKIDLELNRIYPYKE